MSNRIYDSERWRRLRRYQLACQPLCFCGRPATDVDHIQPISQGGEPWDMDNLQSLCHEHHSIKTGAEKSGRQWCGEVGADGLPVGGSHWWSGNISQSVDGSKDDDDDRTDWHF